MVNAVGGTVIYERGWLMPRGVRRKPKFLATKLREIRDGLELSQDGMVERLGLAHYLDRGKISDFERGVREPDLLTLKAYADEAGISVDDLIDDDVRLPRKLPSAERTRGPKGGIS
ncbi:MAG: helix-turn-helix transcriptional regulator [Blastocatellia bacterium]|nr:helix-turn-helix transcriptional regulator [Blastocatellia bacterium]